jgi:hypothetical protein
LNSVSEAGITHLAKRNESTMSAPTSREQILGIVNNHWQSCCVGAAAELELADLLAEGPLPIHVLAERSKTYGPPWM